MICVCFYLTLNIFEIKLSSYAFLFLGNQMKINNVSIFSFKKNIYQKIFKKKH